MHIFWPTFTPLGTNIRLMIALTNIPMISGSTPARRHCSESYSDALTSAAAKALFPSPPLTSSTPATLYSPSKVVDVHMQNLEQLRVLKQLFQNGVLTEDKDD